MATYVKFLLPSIKRNTAKIRCSHQVERSTLVYVIIQPVCIQVVRMCSPHKERSVFRVVVFVIILRDFDGQVFADITFVLTVKSHTIIFRMSHYKDLAAAVCHCKEKPCFIGFSKHCQFFTVMDISMGTSVCLE